MDRTRLKRSGVETFGVHKYLRAIFGLWVGVDAIIVWSWLYNWFQGKVNDVELGIFLGINVFMYCFVVCLTTNLRVYLRQQYQIPQPCGCFMDFILSAVFTPWVIAQMGRHTGDYNNHDGYFFTKNGFLDEIELSDPESTDGTCYRQTEGATMYTPPPIALP